MTTKEIARITCDLCHKFLGKDRIHVRWERYQNTGSGGSKQTWRQGEYGEVCSTECELRFFTKAMTQTLDVRQERDWLKEQLESVTKRAHELQAALIFSKKGKR